MKIPKGIEKVIQNFERLPGIGPKSAQRLAFYLLHVPQSNLDEFAQSLSNLKTSTVMCTTCYNIGDTEICAICDDPHRDQSLVCIVEDPLDLIAIEKGNQYKGVYHVLHGVIDPLNSIGPDDIYIPQLLERLSNGTQVSEIILATNPTLEGEATAMYMLNKLKTQSRQGGTNLKITRIGRGLPTGADLEFADETTIQRALEGRREY